MWYYVRDSKTSDSIVCCQDVKQSEHSYSLEIVNQHSHFGEQFDDGLPKPELISWIEHGGEPFRNWRESQKSRNIICSSSDLHFDPGFQEQLFWGSQQAVNSRKTKSHFQLDPLESQCSFGSFVSLRSDQGITLRSPQRHNARTPPPLAHGPSQSTLKELPSPRNLDLPGLRDVPAWESTQHPRPVSGESCWENNHLGMHQRGQSKDRPHKAWEKLNKRAEMQMPRSSPPVQRHFRCGVCAKSFRRKLCLLSHLAAHAARFPFQSADGEMCFRHEQAHPSHHLLHQGEKPAQCTPCGMRSLPVDSTQARRCQRSREGPASWRESRGASSSVHSGEKAQEESGHQQGDTEALQHLAPAPCSCLECGERCPTSALACHCRAHTGEKPFQCPHCNKRFCLRRLLQVHQHAHGGERPFSCRKCGKGFAKQCKLTEHIRVHSGEKPFWCAKCGRNFRQRGQLLRHQRLHTDEKPFQCPECGLSFRLESMLRAHRLRHGGERPFSCSECGRGFTHQCKLREHLRVHSGERPFQCLECDKRFRLKGILKAHQHTHSKERPFSCGECGKGFTRQSKLTEHLRVHSGERPFQCPECSRSFRLKGQLLSHQRLHTGERPFQCPECDKRYRVKADMKAHQLLHSGEMPFSCECGKGFVKHSKLIEHVRTHTGEKPFQCPKCDKSFRLKAQLLSHQGLHTGERPFHCPDCDKNFRERGHMLRHQRIHRPERPFACGDCGKGFIYKSKLAEHIRVHTKSCPAPNELDIKKRLSQLFAMIEADWS
ncbi:PREDICTED: zinc finger protein 786 isoform X2 [Rhinopithecus bieti]|uniref:zinc finger protein 786 isoform X2 n=1 Tax=Rhinopithecus bieti TaxID=61621 RepID=UPI00083BF07F|nr:PREDICTED: zinc finger protein 786 isoform X2 [Rhinopithecus bieti]